jgi:hypothetical protein
MNDVQQVVGGRIHPSKPSENHTHARLTGIKPENICVGMACAKWCVVNLGLVDLTNPLAQVIPSYIPGNIQYQDAAKNQPTPSWFHFENVDDDTGNNMPFLSSFCSAEEYVSNEFPPLNCIDFNETFLPSAAAAFQSEPAAGPSHEVGTKSFFPRVKIGWWDNLFINIRVTWFKGGNGNGSGTDS